MSRQRWRVGFQAVVQRWRSHHSSSRCVAVDLDSTWVTRFEMRLTDALQPDDVWFQLHAEAAEQAGLAGQAMALDFKSEHDRTKAEVLYRVSAVPWVLLMRVQAALQSRGWRLSRLGVHDAQNDAMLATSAINFLPHRQMRLRHSQRQFGCRCAVALLCGVLCAHGVRMGWALAVSHLGADEATQALAEKTWRDTQAQHDAMHFAWQQHNEAQSQQQAQQLRQQQNLQWQTVLQANQAAVWYAKLVQEGSSWRLLGQALTEGDVQHLQTQLAAAPIWQTAPTLKQWTALPPSPDVRLPVWQFELMGVLREASTPTATAEAPAVGNINDKARGSAP